MNKVKPYEGGDGGLQSAHELQEQEWTQMF
jgi:hypothetical protein